MRTGCKVWRAIFIIGVIMPSFSSFGAIIDSTEIDNQKPGMKNRLCCCLMLVFLFGTTTVLAQNSAWGWQAHRYINEHAVDYLPEGMSFFLEHVDYLRDHAVDPDTDPLPGFYHYIDIDTYPEFFEGTLPHDMDELIAIYGVDVVEDTGIIPWIVEEWTDDLRSLMADGNWDEVWQVAAELGHYVGDSHQPLHLTENYNGELTGNDGIHSRYETHLINDHLDELVLPTGMGEYWPNVIDSTFEYIDQMYAFVDDVIAADDLAVAQDPGYNNEYYNIMWEELEEISTISIHKAIIDLACVWITAWEDAGSPTPDGTDISENNAGKVILARAHPNPFSSKVQIEIVMPESGFVSLKIYNQVGQEVAILYSDKLAHGSHNFTWHASDFSSGLYFYRLEIDEVPVWTERLALFQ